MQQSERAGLISTVNLVVLKVLEMAGPAGMTAEHLSVRAGFSRPTMFKALEELASYNVVEKHGSVWKVRSSSAYAVKAVALFDLARYLELDKSVKREIDEVARAADSALGVGSYGLIAYGSSIGEKHQQADDLDLLLVAEEATNFTVSTSEMKASISVLSPAEIDEMWTGGELFVQEAVSRGIIVRDIGERLALMRISKPREFDPEKALDSFLYQYGREWPLMEEAFSNKNWEEFAFHQSKAAAALVRIWLLGIGVRPRSRPELADQLGMFSRRLRDTYEYLTGQGPANQQEAKRRNESFWEFRASTTHLSDSNEDFATLLRVLRYSEKDARKSLAWFLGRRGLSVCPGQKSDLVVSATGKGRKVFMTLKSLAGMTGPSSVREEFHRGDSKEPWIFIYNPHRNLPPDERRYEVSGRVRMILHESRVTLVPFNEFFSWGCDVIEDDLRGRELLESLASLGQDRGITEA